MTGVFESDLFMAPRMPKMTIRHAVSLEQRDFKYFKRNRIFSGKLASGDTVSQNRHPCEFKSFIRSKSLIPLPF